MAIEPIKGFYVHDEATDTDGVAKYDYSELANLPFGDDVTEVSFKTRGGYINVAGNQEGPGSDTQEVYTNKIPCFSGDTFTIDLDWNGNTSSKWVGFATFDKDGRFITRNVFGGWNTNATTATLTTPAIPDGSYYIAFTYRTYGDCTVNIKHEGSYFDIRNRADKGLLISDEWDTAGGVDTDMTATGVLRLGYMVLSDFVNVAGKPLCIEKSASYTSGLIARVMYFDGDKNYLTTSAWKTVGNTTFATPINVVYARVQFDATNNPSDSSSPTAETVRENTRIYTATVSEALTPIITGYSTNGGVVRYLPEWDTVNHTFTIPNDSIFFKDGKYFHPSSLSGTGGADTVLNIPTDSSSAMRLYFNLSTNNYIWRAYNTNTTSSDDLILVAVFRINKPGTSFRPSLSIACPYKIDGKLYGIDTTAEVDFEAIAWAFNENVKGINHRGYNTAPENTLPAYKLSKQVGFTYCETDVSYTSDGVAVLLHDNTINRTARNADGTEISGDIAINSITYEQALTYDFGIYKGSQYAGTKIPTFEQFIKLCKNLGLHPYIELKTGTEAQTQGLIDTVKQYGMEGRVTWISFSSQLLTYVKNYDATARLGFVVGNVTTANITTAQGLKTTDNEVFIDCSGITSEMVAACASANIPVEIWTVNSASTIEGLDPYISGVTSDSLIAAKVLYEANV